MREGGARDYVVDGPRFRPCDTRAMASLRLYLVRHGEVAANSEGRYIGLGDETLTERGLRQAEALGAAFADIEVAAVYSSPLRRALQTARSIAAARQLEVLTDDLLTEMSFGEWEGLTSREVADRSAGDRELAARWMEDPELAPPGGESLASVTSRILGFVDHRRAQGHHAVVAISHVGPIKALLCAALGLPLGSSKRMFLDPATVSVIDWGETPVLRLFNSHAHLGWRNARWMAETSTHVDT